MLLNAETNLLYLADCLPDKFPAFYSDFERLLKESNIKFELLPNTKDIWAVDYMPIQVTKDDFVKFVYYPDYLQYTKYINAVSDGGAIADSLGINSIKSDIVLDGGNVVNSSGKVILCDKVVKENGDKTRPQLIAELKETFRLDSLFLVPRQPGDFTGHSDGMLRFIDENTILVNDYSRERPTFQKAFSQAVHETGLDSIVLPYNPYENSSIADAKGIYINYLEMNGIIILPIYGQKEDEEAVRLMEGIFTKSSIKTIDCNDIAKHGGILNCISWNIQV